MLINSASAAQYQTIQQQQQTSRLPVNTQSTTQTAASTTSISEGAQQLQLKELDIANKYDVTNMSEDERISMSKELLEDLIIGIDEFAVMSFPMDKMRDNMGIAYNKGEKINLVEQFTNSLAVAKQQGASAQEISIREDLVSIVKNLSKLSRS